MILGECTVASLTDNEKFINFLLPNCFEHRLQEQFKRYGQARWSISARVFFVCWINKKQLLFHNVVLRWMKMLFLSNFLSRSKFSLKERTEKREWEEIFPPRGGKIGNFFFPCFLGRIACLVFHHSHACIYVFSLCFHPFIKTLRNFVSVFCSMLCFVPFLLLIFLSVCSESVFFCCFFETFKPEFLLMSFMGFC